MKTIKDSVHDHIEVAGVALSLLDTPPVQRLRHVKQLGTVELVYPAANHTRFEHSLGVYHLACEALDHLGIGGRNAERVRAAAILHDVGHAPYSHNLEPLVERRTGNAHDDVDDVLETNEVATVLEAHDLDPWRVARLIAGEGSYAGIVSGEIDVDRMDYLVRDAHHTGVPYGTIDHGRLIRELALDDGELVLSEGNVQTAESLLVARALMNPVVYNHHVARISKAMLRRAVDRLIETSDVTAGEVRRWDDHDLHAALRGTPETAEAAERIATRDLYKRAVWVGMEGAPDDLVDADFATRTDLEAQIADDAGVDPDDVILDVPPRPSMRESDAKVRVRGEVRSLAEQSALVEALRAAQREQWRLGVYTTADLVEAVGHAAERTLGLSTEGDRLTDRTGRFMPLDEFEADGGRGPTA